MYHPCGGEQSYEAAKRAIHGSTGRPVSVQSHLTIRTTSRVQSIGDSGGACFYSMRRLCAFRCRSNGAHHGSMPRSDCLARHELWGHDLLNLSSLPRHLNDHVVLPLVVLIMMIEDSCDRVRMAKHMSTYFVEMVNRGRCGYFYRPSIRERGPGCHRSAINNSEARQ